MVNDRETILPSVRFRRSIRIDDGPGSMQATSMLPANCCCDAAASFDAKLSSLSCRERRSVRGDADACQKSYALTYKNIGVIGINRQGCTLSMQLRIDHGRQDFCDDERT